MISEFTGEQRMIQTLVRQFSRDVVSVNTAERDRTGAFPDEILKEIGELGLMGMMIPFKYNGSGADTVGSSEIRKEVISNNIYMDKRVTRYI